MKSFASVLLPVPPTPCSTYAHSGWLRMNGAANRRSMLLYESGSPPVQSAMIWRVPDASFSASTLVQPVSTIYVIGSSARKGAISRPSLPSNPGLRHSSFVAHSQERVTPSLTSVRVQARRSGSCSNRISPSVHTKLHPRRIVCPANRSASFIQESSPSSWSSLAFVPPYAMRTGPMGAHRLGGAATM